jgi:hypothetical protein
VNTRNDGQFGQSGGESPGRGPFNERVQLEEIRAFLAERRKHTSLRKLADEIGISKTSVDDLVKDFHRSFVREPKKPYGNRQKLRDWYLVNKYREAGMLRDLPVDMAILFQEAVADLPEPDRGESLERLVQVLGDIFDRKKVPHPAWLKRLEAALAGEPGPPAEPEGEATAE